MFLHSAIPLMPLYQCIKFNLITFNTFRDILWTRILLQKLRKGNNSVITCDELLFLHSALSLMGLYQCIGGGRVVRCCSVNFQCWGVLLIWIIVGQGPIALAIGAGGGCLDIFSLVYHFSFLSPSLWEMARYSLKYCLKGPLRPKTTNQPTFNVSSFI